MHKKKRFQYQLNDTLVSFFKTPYNFGAIISDSKVFHKIVD